MTANVLDRTFWFAHKGHYGRFVSDWIKGITGPSIFLDIGANQGLFTILAATNPAFVEVHAFEPQKRMLKLLARNLAINGAEQVIVHPHAISSSPGVSAIGKKWRHSGAASLREAKAPASELVSVIGPDYLDREVTISLPIYAKIDVEGWEREVIAALFDSGIGSNIRGVMVEENSMYFEPGEIEVEMAKYGLTLLSYSGTNNPRDLCFGLV